jgi:hypothetical protein
VNERQRVIAIRILREQEVTRSMRNDVIRRNFGDRLTIALTAECEQRDREIDAILATIEMLDGIETSES